MGLLDFFKKGDASSNAELDGIFHQMVNEANSKSKTYSFNAYDTLEAYKRLTALGRNKKVGFLFECFSFVPKSWKSGVYSHNGPWSHGLRMIGFFLKELKFSDDELLRICQGFKVLEEEKIPTRDIPYRALLSTIEVEIRERGLNAMIEQGLRLLPIHGEYLEADSVKINELIDFLLQGNPNQEINKHDIWGRVVTQYLSVVDIEKRPYWIGIFKVTRSASGKGEPSKKWLKEAQTLVEGIGGKEFAEKMVEWLSLMKTRLQEIHKDKGYKFDFLRDDNHDMLKGLIWCTGFVNDTQLNSTMDDYAAWAYKKKPGIGPISAKTGTACMCAFSMLPIKDGVSRLSKFRSKIKNNTILKAIDKFIRVASEKHGIGLQEIQERSVPSFNIIEGHMHVAMGNCTAIYNVEDGVLSWMKGDKSIKSAPTEVKENFNAELKTLKNTVKEIDALLSVIKDRLEHSYLDQRSWAFNNWCELYLNHPLTSVIVRKLIWHFDGGDKKTQGMFANERLEDVNGDEIGWLNDSVNVQLWHPIGFGMSDILAWRNSLKERNIIQPFKQAYREVYMLTDAELKTEVYSNRFAAHILRQHQFAALCRQRGWHYTLMGNWDSHNTPYINIPSCGMEAQFLVNSDWQESAANDMGIFNYITTDQVCFTRHNERIPLQDVPAMVLTEIMRDVDLFVGVTSLGNDPAWQDGGNVFMNTYWHEYSFKDLTESAMIRSEVLQSIIPKLKIASQCSFDKKFLIVKGKVRTYKIHMGSGNILMEPNDEYLCIVPDGSKRTKENVFLPFEGDNLLSIILSKALLLAEDDKVTDTTIMSQIRRK